MEVPTRKIGEEKSDYLRGRFMVGKRKKKPSKKEVSG